MAREPVLLSGGRRAVTESWTLRVGSVYTMIDSLGKQVLGAVYADKCTLHQTSPTRRHLLAHSGQKHILTHSNLNTISLVK